MYSRSVGSIVPAWNSWLISDVIDRKQCGTFANIRKLLRCGISGARLASFGDGTATLFARGWSGRAMYRLLHMAGAGK